MKILIVVAHPDDEILGVGGTIAKHIIKGDEVYVLILAEGKSSRFKSYNDFDPVILENFKHESDLALKTIGVKNYELLNLESNRLDRYDLLDIIKIIEDRISKIRPQVIYTHYYNDLNLDHEIIARAVVTAARPLHGTTVNKILMFETLSSTEYGAGLQRYMVPNYIVDISETLETKVQAFQYYSSESQAQNRPRSATMIRHNAELWGAKFGVRAAEVFYVSRILE